MLRRWARSFDSIFRAGVSGQALDLVADGVERHLQLVAPPADDALRDGDVKVLRTLLRSWLGDGSPCQGCSMLSQRRSAVIGSPPVQVC
jgi:hypothetical protein